jgi:hypothetical protein
VQYSCVVGPRPLALCPPPPYSSNAVETCCAGSARGMPQVLFLCECHRLSRDLMLVTASITVALCPWVTPLALEYLFRGISSRVESSPSVPKQSHVKCRKCLPSFGHTATLTVGANMLADQCCDAFHCATMYNSVSNPLRDRSSVLDVITHTHTCAGEWLIQGSLSIQI